LLYECLMGFAIPSLLLFRICNQTPSEINRTIYQRFKTPESGLPFRKFIFNTDFAFPIRPLSFGINIPLPSLADPHFNAGIRLRKKRLRFYPCPLFSESAPILNSLCAAVPNIEMEDRSRLLNFDYNPKKKLILIPDP
jgi:hypothetical protein